MEATGVLIFRIIAQPGCKQLGQGLIQGFASHFRAFSSVTPAAQQNPYEVPPRRVRVGTRHEAMRKPLRGPAELPASEKAPKWDRSKQRCGALGMKVGMMGIWDQWGQPQVCTVVQLDACQVIQVKTEETDGYDGIQLGVGEAKLKNVIKPLLGHYEKALAVPKRHLREFRVSKDGLIPVGTMILAQHFVPGQYVDVQGVTKGKGFQGVMKRWGFKGLNASHGVSLSHRSAGSTGQCQDPGRVFKGKKMAGRMGGDNITMHNLKILKIDCARNVLYVKGSIPGVKGGWLRIKDAVKGAKFPVPPPFPTFKAEEGKEYPKEIWEPLPKDDPLAPREEPCIEI